MTAQGGNVAVGTTVSVPVVLSDAPNGVSGFALVVTLGNGNVASITDVSIPGFGLVSYDLVSGKEVRLKVADLQGLIESGAANVTLATLSIQGLKKGGSDIQIQVVRIDDDEGYSMDVEVLSGSLNVKNVSGGGSGKGGGGGSGGKGDGKGGGKGRNK